MNKSNNIRKKALQFVKNRQWDKALNEYIRLSDIEEHNPTVFNELGDLHLKLGNKREAVESFYSAIDAYGRVSLFNNAVAVCKKIIRMSPNDHTVYGKLARLRYKQGLRKEAISYAMTFLERIVQDISAEPDTLRDRAKDLASTMPDVPEVLERVADHLNALEFKEESLEMLEKLESLYKTKGKTERCQAVREKMNAFRGGESTPPTPTGQEEPQSAETEGESFTGFDGSSTGDDDARSTPGLPTEIGTPTTESAPSTDVAANFGTVELEARSVGTVETAPDETPEPQVPKVYAIDENESSADLLPEEPANKETQETGIESTVQTELPAPLGDDEVWVPKEELPDGLQTTAKKGDVFPVSDIVGQFSQEVSASVDGEDHRSHYDLGMAYLEMDLLTEAVREFQAAATSSRYQARCLEMIGLCFLKQKQPKLAIKQLEKGLELVGKSDRASLGIQYNLGLAYEMVGDTGKAKTCFEDVYVVDVTFREVGEKIKEHGG